MDQVAQGPPVKQTKKTLRFKIALIVVFATISPYLLGLFIPLTTILYILAAAASAILAVVLVLWILRPLDAFGDLNQRINFLSKTIQQLENNQAVAISEKNKFEEILSSIIDGIIALDFNKNIVFLNKASGELTGYREGEVAGKPIEGLLHLFSDSVEILPKTYCQGGFNQTAKLIGKDGKQTKVNLATTRVDNAIPSNLSCILLIHDLSKEEELEQMKLDFVSMASHELKTPLTSIVGYISVFINENKGKISPENFDLLTKAFVAAKQLQTLIANLLNVNKIEKEQLAVSPGPLEYMPILSKVVEDLRSQANQKNIVLNITPPAVNLPKILADPIRLSEVITNLVSNAINYTNPNGKVEISLQVSPAEVTTTVSDNGVGIPPEAIPHLFNKFYRVSNSLQQANKGTGLGLYITKSIIEKLHGKIWVESQVGKGSKFSFTLPIVTQTAGILRSNQFVSQAIQSGTLNY